MSWHLQWKGRFWRIHTLKCEAYIFFLTYIKLKRLGSVRCFLLYWKEVCIIHQGFIYLIKNAVNCNIVKYYHNLLLLFLFYENYFDFASVMQI